MGTHGPRAVVLDAGALIAYERGSGRMRALLRLAATTKGSLLVVPAGVVAQVWRDGARQARLGALLSAERLRVEVLDEPLARAAAVLCGRSGAADIVDASVVLATRVNNAVVVTSDAADLARLDPGINVVEV